MIIHYTYVIINHNDNPPDFCREESDMIKQIMNLANFVDFFYHTFRGVASKKKIIYYYWKLGKNTMSLGSFQLISVKCCCIFCLSIE